MNERLRQELLTRGEEDQKARSRGLINLTSKEAQEIDNQNTARMKEIVDKYGWPGKSLVGVGGANMAWLLVQHADHDHHFQKYCLLLLAGAVVQGEATGEHLAYLTDRVRVAEGKKQVYGTQFQWVDGKLEPFPIEDETRVDERRRAVGLETMAEHIASWRHGA